MNDKSYAVLMRKEQAKRDGFHTCYPMAKHDETHLIHHKDWETFSFIWDLAIMSTQSVEKMTVTKEKCASGCTYSKAMNQSYPRACVHCNTKEMAH